MQGSRTTARLSDVAQLAGVSPGLVSRLVNEDPTLKIRPETRERVMDAIDMLQYTPHASARALRSARTGLLGFALHHVNDPIYAQLVESAQTAAAERNYSVVLLNASELVGRRDAYRALVGGHRVDGLLVQSGFGADNSGLQELVLSIPSVVFNASAMPGIRTVRLDDSTASAIATRHLVELGHTRIAFVGAEGASSDRRFQGYAEALDDAGLQSLPMVSGGWSASEARKGIEQYFSSGGRATALVVATSTSALGVHAGVISSGRSIPDDVSLVCIQDAWFAEHLNPPLTAVELPLGDVGRLAVNLLIEQIASHTEGEVVLGDPPPALIERESTSVPGADPV